MNITPEELKICLKVLQQVSEDPAPIDSCDRFKSLIAKIYKNARKTVRHALKQKQQAEDLQVKATTAIVQAQKNQNAIAALPCTLNTQESKLFKPAKCYICKQFYSTIHFFYHMLCPTCAELNYQKRNIRTDLTGRVALVTGGRIKIGYQIALKMLRDGAKVVVTTRFPHDAARRFASETDFEQWNSRLQIYGLDLRNISAMEGQFNRESKTIHHPHTNMAKAALNMMTRTSASDYARNGIYMNSVDTGWITDENPYPKKRHLCENLGFYTPLDAIDGMARIYDPIVRGIEEAQEPFYGHFLKDYFSHSW